MLKPPQERDRRLRYSMAQSSFRSLVMVALAASVTVASADLAIARLVPVVHRREVQEGMQDLERTDPETLVIASSHARTFHALGLELASQTGGQRSLVAIPLEFGKLTSYAWLLDHRVRPLIDGGDEASNRKRSALKRFIVLTEWWDSCVGPDWNIPSRAWTFEHYQHDILVHGANSYNRNYVQSRWKRLLWNSALAQDRGANALFGAVRDKLAHRSNSDSLAATTVLWQQSVEAGTECIGNGQQMAALLHLIEFGVSHHLETAVVLFPRKPSTLTTKAKQTTLASFHEMVMQLTRPRNVRLIDLTWSTPLTDEDFMADFDHVNAEGNVKFARWALDGPLSFMKEPPRPTQDKETP